MCMREVTVHCCVHTIIAGTAAMFIEQPEELLFLL